MIIDCFWLRFRALCLQMLPSRDVLQFSGMELRVSIDLGIGSSRFEDDAPDLGHQWVLCIDLASVRYN